MSKSDAFENGLLELIFQNVATDLSGIGSGLQASATAGSLWVSLHTSDPGDAGTAITNEMTTGAYNTYARVAVARSAGGWTVTGNSVTSVAAAVFPAGTGGTGATATHFGIVSTASGAGLLLYKGAISPTIACGNGVTPSVTPTITED